MLPVTSAATTRTLDQTCIEALGVPGRQLMEVAGRAAAAAIARAHPGATVAVLCGGGNNGGDGSVVARWLQHWGHPVRIWRSGPARTPDASTNAALCQRMGLAPVGLDAALDGADVAVDALLGTGQRGPARGATGEALRALQTAALPTVALDLPTGIHADTGQILDPCAVRAERTVTFGRWKPGLLAMPGAAHAGVVELVDIGLDLAALAAPELAHPDAWLIEAADVSGWLPRDEPGSAKWDRGHVAIRGGLGASVLAALGASAAGAGLVTVLAPRAEWPSLHGLPPHVILAEPSALDPRRHDVLVLGPGLGLDARARDEALDLWDHFPRPIVGDADLLTHLAGRPAGDGQRSWGPDRLITPHSAEAARLLGWTRGEVEADRFQAARVLGEGAVLKGPHTLLGGPRPWVNPTGSVRLATAGSGDVLAGLMGGLLARGLSAREAAAAACWLHGEAGERLADNGTATDLAARIRLQPGG